MAQYAIIKNNIVENVIEAETNSGVLITLQNQGYVVEEVTETMSAAIGWSYSEEDGFKEPVPSEINDEPVVEE